jgi:hypothetical protein
VTRYRAGPWRRRPAALGLLAVALVLVAAGPAGADPAGPTDYRTTIVAIEPPTPGVELRILGGDSFVELAADAGVEVRVVGYRAEPYLWFDVDGTVWQNETSTSRWLNDDRYGGAEVPPQADDEAEPTWVAVSSDGTHAWHDHRAHWMNPDRPIGAEAGDTILEAVIPLEVDGEPVAVQVRSTLLAGPSPVAAALGAVAAAVTGLAALARVRGRPGSGPAVDGPVVAMAPMAPLAVVALWSLLASAVGLASVVGLPAQAAPGPARWLLPAVAAVVSAGAALALGWGRMAPPLGALLLPAALALAGLELLLWAWIRRLVLTRALVPGVAPAWLDRLTVAGAAVTGVIAVSGAALVVLRARSVAATGPRREPRRSR